MPITPNTAFVSYNKRPPVVLSFGALDPAGGGGIQADIETAASLGCHCAPIVTALRTSGGPNSTATVAINSTIIIEQARSVLEDMAVAAIKVGFMGSVANTEALHSILRDYPHTPVVLHPELSLWDPNNADQSGLMDALAELLLPQATVISMGLTELREIAPEADTLDASAQAIINRGCDYLLIRGTHQSAQQQAGFQNSLYRPEGLFKNYQWEQAAPNCRSSASTLTSSIAAYLAHNSHPISAIEQGQTYTWQTLVAARQLGSGEAIPHRFFWADPNATLASEPPAERGTH